MTVVKIVSGDDNCSVCLLAVMTAAQLPVLQALNNSQGTPQKPEYTTNVLWHIHMALGRCYMPKVTNTYWPEQL